MHPPTLIPSRLRPAARSRAGFLLALLLCLPGLVASSVRATSIVEMIAGSELVFEGRALSSRAQSDPENDRLIYTFVRFEVSEVLKGSWSEPTIELRFLGGRIDERRLQVSDMTMPATGERGVYFVESLAQRLIHPLFGWAQGHLRIVEDSQGQKRVYASDLQPIVSVRNVAAATGLSRGIAEGLTPGSSEEPAEALRLEDFKQQLRRMIPAPKP